MKSVLKFIETIACWLSFAMAGIYLFTWLVVLRSPVLEQFIFDYGYQLTIGLASVAFVAGKIAESAYVPQGAFALFGVIVCIMVGAFVGPVSPWFVLTLCTLLFFFFLFMVLFASTPAKKSPAG